MRFRHYPVENPLLSRTIRNSPRRPCAFLHGPGSCSMDRSAKAQQIQERFMKPFVRILIVTEDWPSVSNGGFLQWRDQPMPDAIGDNSRDFHLGEFVDVLVNTAWVGFTLEITKAHRSLPGTGGMNEAALKADRGADVVGFRFNQPFTVNGATRSLSDYDMALFFGINAVNADSALAAEAEAVAQFMESGGGFFATGDHQNLGAALCGLLPRVRSMRRWFYTGDFTSLSPPGPNGEPPAPPALGAHRHDTTQPGPDDIVQFEDQSDEVPQTIAPTMYGAGFTVRQGYPAHSYLPHPLLCSPDGAVTFLPDHMHEGWCEVPDNLGGRTFKLGAVNNVREYPDYTPSGGGIAEPLAPEVVATGTMVAGTSTPALDTAHTGSTTGTEGKVFGVIGAWDGHLVSKGRVVVDSTFHHFFNINLTGDRFLEDDNLPAAHKQKLHGFYVPDGMGGREPAPEYRMIMWYFRNIVYWLIPASRQETIGWHSLAQLVRRPQLVDEIGSLTADANFKRFELGHYFYFGQLAKRYFDGARGACYSYVIHRILYKPKIPWWEWIQDIVEIWSPRTQREKTGLAHERLVGLMGIGPQPEVVATIGLGAAVVTAACVRREISSATDPAQGVRAAQSLMPSVLDHAAGKLGAQLQIGARALHKMEKLVATQLSGKTDTAG
ncbi:MAG TPA: hypothetical protein VFK02_27475 [Kofleriaceae bacterium]|nr:hypothetical protein [Kofleriaceae bacterium]